MEGLGKSNYSSNDNPLAFPGGGGGQQQHQPHYNQTPPPQATAGAGGGGPTKSNLTSQDNPMALGGGRSGGAFSPRQMPQKAMQMQQQMPQMQEMQMQQEMQPTPQIQMQQLPPPQMQPQMNEQQQQPGFDLRYDVDMSNKAAYKRALDAQVNAKEVHKFNEQRAQKQSEMDTLKQYPFGRRTDPQSYLMQNGGTQSPAGQQQMMQQMMNNQNQIPAAGALGGYQPSFPNNGNIISHGQETYGLGGDQTRKLNKDNVVEKINSLQADIPPYDPIKHRSGNYQGYTYDPWGKPGGGAPMIDPESGKKMMKMSGQVWYDQIGLNPDDRAKAYADVNRPITLDDQHKEMDAERKRRGAELHEHKARAGDVATWITGIESKRAEQLGENRGASLQHTNVTRDKVNKEFARRGVNEQTNAYHQDLGAQLEERYRQEKLTKLKDDVAGMEHTKRWDDWWGKPGGGAPTTDRRRRDIDTTLEPMNKLTASGHFQTPRDSAINEFSALSLPLGQRPMQQPNGNMSESEKMLYAKSVQSSNHKNLYDNQVQMKL